MNIKLTPEERNEFQDDIKNAEQAMINEMIKLEGKYPDFSFHVNVQKTNGIFRTDDKWTAIISNNYSIKIDRPNDYSGDLPIYRA